MLVKFSVSNYRSVVAEAALDMRHPEFTAPWPADRRWSSVIYGAGTVSGETMAGKTDIFSCLAGLSAAVAGSADDPALTKKLFHPHPYHVDEPTTMRIFWVSDGYRYDFQLTLSREGVRKESLRVRDEDRWLPLYTRTADKMFFHTDSGVNFAATRIITEMLTPWTLAVSAWRAHDRGTSFDTALSWLADAIVRVPTPFHRERGRQNREWSVLLDSMVTNPGSLSSLPTVLKSLDPTVESVTIDEHLASPALRRPARFIDDCLAGRVTTDINPGSISHADLQDLIKKMRVAHINAPDLVIGSATDTGNICSWLFITAAVAAARLLGGGLVLCDFSDAELPPELMSSLIFTARCQVDGLEPAQIIVASTQPTVPSVIARALPGAAGHWMVEPSTGGGLSISHRPDQPAAPQLQPRAGGRLLNHTLATLKTPGMPGSANPFRSDGNPWGGVF
ncbi:hypothetical protein JZY06_10695 [Corynebacterium sp. CCM 8862]|uniref:Uncharacterized protein n=1 Tax=Corynebacterium mendelii TaxID=2765362 RepID=A0A939E160_9CORY|nr:hypothetical protein [Corynebacterium mendelii]MBN9645070.1 hypothetical protein [Corynebacterium mendelii]